MEPAQAERGRDGPASRLLIDDLVQRGVSIVGDPQFGHDGRAPVMKLIRSHHAEAPDHAIGRANGLTGVAQGHLGQMTRNLTGPVQFVRKLMEFWHLDMLDAVAIMGYDSDDIEYVSAVLDGKEQFRGRDVRDRIAHLFCIRRALWSLFRDLDVENDWLREQHHMLNEKSPLSLMLEGSMEGLLLAREYVDSAAGIR